MPDILHDFIIHAPAARVFEAVSTPEGLDQWWTKRSAGSADQGAEWERWFGQKYDWRGRITHCVLRSEIEWLITSADDEWTNTRVGFTLSEKHGNTEVRFHHANWPDLSSNFRFSSFCWAMYLRLLKRWVEHGETVPYESRLSA